MCGGGDGTGYAVWWRWKSGYGIDGDGEMKLLVW